MGLMTQTSRFWHATLQTCPGAGGRSAMLGSDPEYRAMVAVDVERSAGRGNVAMIRYQEVLFSAVREAGATSEIDVGACHWRDLGDGVLLVGPAGLPTARFIYPFTHHLAA